MMFLQIILFSLLSKKGTNVFGYYLKHLFIDVEAFEFNDKVTEAFLFGPAKETGR